MQINLFRPPTSDITCRIAMQERVIHKSIKEAIPFSIMLRDQLAEESKFEIISSSYKDFVTDSPEFMNSTCMTIVTMVVHREYERGGGFC